MKRRLLLALFLLLATGIGSEVFAQQAPLSNLSPPPVQIDQGSLLNADALVALDEGYALPIQLLLTLTLLAFLPSIVMMMTSFTRLIIIFGLLRQAIGLQTSPPNQVLVGLSLFLSIFIMHPVLKEVNDKSVQPLIAGEITQQQAFDRAEFPMKVFMLEHTREKDLLLFMDLARTPQVATPSDVPLHILVPAFVISELRVAFQIGFMLFLPFLIIDLLVASILMSMGMMMLPPIMISLPIKLLMFVLTDGWYLIVESLVLGYSGAG